MYLSGEDLRVLREADLGHVWRHSWQRRGRIWGQLVGSGSGLFRLFSGLIHLLKALRTGGV